MHKEHKAELMELENYIGKKVVITNPNNGTAITFRIKEVLETSIGASPSFPGKEAVAEVKGTAFYQTADRERVSRDVKLLIYKGFSIGVLAESQHPERGPRPLTKEQSKQKGIALAQEAMRSRGGPVPGEIVAHPTELKPYTFVKREGDIAFVSRPGEYSVDGMETRKQFPVDELFNHEEALGNALKIFRESNAQVKMN